MVRRDSLESIHAEISRLQERLKVVRSNAKASAIGSIARLMYTYDISPAELTR